MRKTGKWKKKKFKAFFSCNGKEEEDKKTDNFNIALSLRWRNIFSNYAESDVGWVPILVLVLIHTWYSIILIVSSGFGRFKRAVAIAGGNDRIKSYLLHTATVSAYNRSKCVGSQNCLFILYYNICGFVHSLYNVTFRNFVNGMTIKP